MQNLPWRHLNRCFVATLAAALAAPSFAADIDSPNTFTLYAGRISAEETWHHVLLKPYSTNYTDQSLVTAAYSRAYRESHEGALRTEFEGNITYNFGDHDYWEVNFVPVTLRWQRFPWSEHLDTSIAFGAGFSYTFEYPRIEHELENETQQFLIFWLLEFTAGPRDGPWSAVIRLHHRSPGWGLMGVDDGGMNAPSIGFRYQF
jgi:hypothetical protein